MNKTLTETFGWIGVSCIIVAYALSTFGQIRPDQPMYLLLNGFGAIGIIVDSSRERDWQPVVLNIFWLVIAVTGLVRYLLT